jgi:hypothetical protein
VLADELDGPVDVLSGFRMERDEGGAGRREVRNDPINRLHHQVYVDGSLDTVFAQCLTNHRPDGEIRHVVIVHHIEVNDVSAGLDDGIDFLAQPGKVGGQD